MAESATITPSELNRRVQHYLEGAPDLQGVYLEAELANFKKHGSGHWYFSLRDADAQVSGVMYRTQAARNSFQQFEEGDRVRAYGSVSVWGARGTYQLTVVRMAPAGEGALWQQLQRLRVQLAEEGLFDPTKKRALPKYPRRVGVITSPTGAVLQDILRTLERRGYPLTLVLLPAVVQGAEATPSLVAQLQAVASLSLDAVIIARGGGSLEDLWAFNSEAVVRAVAACSVPIVSAIGHETDVTLCDLAADLRASTPTAAAELIAPAADALRLALDARLDQLRRAAGERLAEARYELTAHLDGLVLPLQRRIERARHQQTVLTQQLRYALRERLSGARLNLSDTSRRLAAHDTEATLQRGFVLMVDANERAITSVAQLAPNQRVEARWHDGRRWLRAEAKSLQQDLF